MAWHLRLKDIPVSPSPTYLLCSKLPDRENPACLQIEHQIIYQFDSHLIIELYS